MKRAVLICVTLVICCVGYSSFAQEADPQLIFVLIHDVIPDKVEVHNESIKGMVDLSKKHDFRFPVYGYITDSFKYYGDIEIDSMGDIDALFQEMGRVGAASGDVMARYSEMEVASTVSFGFALYMRRPDLSYKPEGVSADNRQAKFKRKSIFHVKYASIAAVEDLLKRFAALYSKKGVGEAFGVTVSVVDRDVSTYIVEEYGESKADFYLRKEKTNALLGDEGKEIWEEFKIHIRSLETEHATYLPELSLPED